MDISELKPTERIVEILHPVTEEKLGVRVSLMSISDERLTKIKRKFQDERLKLDQRGKNFKADEVDENRSILAFSAMTGWEWYGDTVTFKGNKPDFTKPEVLKVFSELSWFRDQVEEAISDEKAFFTKLK